MGKKSQKKEAAKKETKQVKKTAPVIEEPAGEQVVNAETGSHLSDNRAGGIPNPQVVGNE